jgi:hypothetical protein
MGAFERHHHQIEAGTARKLASRKIGRGTGAGGSVVQDDLDRLGRIGFPKNRSGARNQPGGKRNQAEQLGESFASWHRVR